MNPALIAALLSQENQENSVGIFDLTLNDLKEFFKEENKSIWIPTIICCLLIAISPLVIGFLFLY